MMHTLTNSEQRRLAVGILAAVVLLFLMTVVVPIWQFNSESNAEIHFLQTRLNSLRTQAVADRSLRPRHEQLLKVLATSGHHLKSDTEAVAAAELQRIVKNLADKNTAQVLTTQILPTLEETDFVGVALRVRMRGSLEGMLQTLYDMEGK